MVVDVVGESLPIKVKVLPKMQDLRVLEKKGLGPIGGRSNLKFSSDPCESQAGMDTRV